MLAITEIEQEHTAIPLEEQPRVFEEALTEQDEMKLYGCIDWLAQLKYKLPLQYMLKKVQIKQAFQTKKTISLRDFGALVSITARRQEQAERGEKPDVAHVAAKWAQGARTDWAYSDSTHSWYKWSGTHWEGQQEKASQLDQEAVAALQSEGISVNSNQTINTFIRVAASHCKRGLGEVAGKINFLNGTLDIATLQLNPHERNDNFTHCLGYQLDTTGSHPHIDQTLEDTIPDIHARQALLAHIGLSLIRDVSFHNFCLLIGPPRAGKSTLLAVMNAVCGMIDDPFKFAGPSLFSRDLEGKRSRAAWVDYRGVCVDELPGEALREEELLKLMTAHSGVEMRRIGQDERTDNRWKPKLLLSTNDTPHYKDASGAIRQRAIIISCPNGPRPDSLQDKSLIPTKITPEIGAFAWTCLQYALKLKAHGYYPKSANMKKLLDEIEHNDPLKAVIRERCILEPGAKVTSNQLHKVYAEYAEDSGNSPMAKNKMSSAIKDMHIGVTNGEWMRWNNHPTRCLKGIRLRGEFDGDPIEPTFQDDPLLFPLPGQPTPPDEAAKFQQESTEPEQTEEERQLAEMSYPLCMTKDMEPPPAEPCSTCGTTSYAPYWSRWATRKWGCSTCYPQIAETIGKFDPERPDK